MEPLPPPPVPLRPDLDWREIETPPRRRFPKWVVAVCALLALSMGALAVAPLFEGGEESRGPGFHFLDRTDQGTPTRCPGPAAGQPRTEQRSTEGAA